jgi:hypothetical protein
VDQLVAVEDPVAEELPEKVKALGDVDLEETI